jgi:hypothetical protein
MDSIINKLERLDIIDKKKCLCCQNNYIVDDCQYKYYDKLCIICYNNYIDFMSS